MKSSERKENKSTKKQSKPFSTIIVLGGGFEPKKGDAPLQLTIESRIRSLAALEMYKSGMADKIFLSGGKTSGEDQISEAKGMYNFIREQENKYRRKNEAKISDEIFILDEKPYDTSENLEGINEILQKNYPSTDSREAVILSSATHLPRVKELLKSYGVKVKGTVDAETELSNLKDKDGHSYYEGFIEEYARSLRVKKIKAKEFIMQRMLVFDRKALFLRWLAHRTRHGNKSTGDQQD